MVRDFVLLQLPLALGFCFFFPESKLLSVLDLTVMSGRDRGTIAAVVYHRFVNYRVTSFYTYLLASLFDFNLFSFWHFCPFSSPLRKEGAEKP